MTQPGFYTDIEDEKTVAAAPQLTGNTARATWNFSADALNVNTSHYSPEARELLRWCFHYCIDPRHPMRRDEFARHLGYSDNVIYKIYTGTYKHPSTGEQLDVPEKLVAALRSFKRIQQERSMLGGRGFVVTPTVSAIWETCDLCRESQTPGFLFGASRIGKTFALEQYTLRNNHGSTKYVRLGASSGLHGMLRLLAEAVGVSPKSEAKRLIDRIQKAITPNMLLILDEVHLLTYTYRREAFWACIEVLREIYDRTGCGMLMCMTNLGKDRVARERRTELEQMFRRGVHTLELGTMPRVEDLQAICTDSGLEWPSPKLEAAAAGIIDKPYHIIRQLAREEGLTAIAERLRYARKLAAINHESLDWSHYVEAHYMILARATPPKSW